MRNLFFSSTLCIFSLLAGCSFLGPPQATLTPSATVPSPTSTNTIQWFPATDTPTPLATLVPTPTVEVISGLGELIYADRFTQAGLWVTSGSPQGNSLPGDNLLSMSLPQMDPAGSLTSLRLTPTLVDFYARVTAHLSLCRGTDQYSLLFRSASAFDTYRFSANCNGMLRLERVISGKPFVIKDWTFSADAPQGAPGEVQMAVLASGNELRLYLNDRLQFAISDHLLAQGGLGFFIRSEAGNPMSVGFSDLQVYAVNPATPTLPGNFNATPTLKPTP